MTHRKTTGNSRKELKPIGKHTENQTKENHLKTIEEIWKTTGNTSENHKENHIENHRKNIGNNRKTDGKP